MSRFKELLQKAKTNGVVIAAALPVQGFIDVKVVDLDDDLVTLQPEGLSTKFVFHYSNIVVKAT